MYKQLLTGGAILAVLLADGAVTQAKPRTTLLYSQLQQVVPSNTPTNNSTTNSTPNRSVSNPGSNETKTTPAPDGTNFNYEVNGLQTEFKSNDARTSTCEVPIATPTGGGTRERFQALQGCEAAK
jgi:hypothetical protein